MSYAQRRRVARLREAIRSERYKDSYSAQMVGSVRRYDAHCRFQEIPSLPPSYEALAAFTILHIDKGIVTRALPITMAHLLAMSKHVDLANPLDFQTWTQLLASHHLMLRAADGCDFNILRGHVSFHKNGRMCVMLHKRKGNRFGPARAVWASPTPDPLFNLPRLMRKYLHMTGSRLASDVPLFSHINPDGTTTLPIKPLTCMYTAPGATVSAAWQLAPASSAPHHTGCGQEVSPMRFWAHTQTPPSWPR